MRSISTFLLALIVCAGTANQTAADDTIGAHDVHGQKTTTDGEDHGGETKTGDGEGHGKERLTFKEELIHVGIEVACYLILGVILVLLVNHIRAVKSTLLWVEENDKEKVPWIAIGAVASLVLSTASATVRHELQHLQHIANHNGMYIFFWLMGIHVTIAKIRKAGRVMGLATAAGMLVPFGLMWWATGNIRLGASACATDVAFSIGAHNLVANAEMPLAMLNEALTLLAIGDDGAGLVALVALYSSEVNFVFLGLALALLAIAFVMGKKAENASESSFLRGSFIWIVMGSLVTIGLKLGHAEWVIGMCFVYIVAPANVKHAAEDYLKLIVPFVLLLFGLANGAMNLLDPNIYGKLTLIAFACGHFGKIVGIFGFGSLGIWIERKIDPDSKYAHMPYMQMFQLAVKAAVNGAVAIFFVRTAQLFGECTALEGDQMALGFFLTIPAVYLESWAMMKLGWYKDVPEFQPDPDAQAAH